MTVFLDTASRSALTSLFCHHGCVDVHNQPLALLALEDESSAVHPSVSPLECDHRRVPQQLNMRVLSCRVESFAGDILELPFKCCRYLVPSMYPFRGLGIRTGSKEGGVFAKTPIETSPNCELPSCQKTHQLPVVALPPPQRMGRSLATAVR